MTMKTGLFFGSFNPVHIGHLAIADYCMEFTGLDELWFVISPHNPLKPKKSLLPDQDRYDLMELAIGDDHRFRISDIEFRMPRPSYTIDTLTCLSVKHPGRQFYLIMGSDVLSSFDKWKNYREIIRHYRRLIIPRPGTGDLPGLGKENAELVSAPLMEISSSFIRKAIRDKKDIRHFLPPGVYDHILKMNFYA